MKVSVNILNWNCESTLKYCVDAVLGDLKPYDHELIIVDNGSVDDSLDYLIDISKIYPNGKLKVISLMENMGISKGKNTGIKASQGEYIILLDADVVPVPNSLRLLIKYLDDHPECPAIGMHPNKWSRDRVKPNSQKYHETYCDQLFEPRKAQAACLFYGIYRRSMFDSVMMDEGGPFGEAGYGWEDHDFFLQMKAAGFDQWVVHINHPTGKYYHAINSSINHKECLGREKYMETSRVRSKYYHEKWPK